MKIKNKLYTLCICLGAVSLAAQTSSSKFNPWEAGLFIGGSYYQGDLHCRSNNGLGVLSQTNLAYGLFVKKNISPSLGFRANLFRGAISGTDLDFIDNPIHEDRGFSFRSPITEISGVLVWDILGNGRFSSGSFRKSLSPYLIAGFGVQLSNADINWNNQNNGSILTDINQVSNSHLILPYGIGVRLYITEKASLSAEIAARKVFSDYLDGVSEAANPEENDWDVFAGVTLGFRIGKSSDIDSDGIKDGLDKCPDIPGLKKFSGCPDSDGDGVIDEMDKCPMTAGSLDGCPDSDHDGLVDHLDNCPNVKGTMDGCPDTDKDGIVDSEDNCPKTAGIIRFGGCPDTDGDEIMDLEDRCPNQAGLLINGGCPFVDTDGDGIQDALDKCPTVAGVLSTSGCPKTKIKSSIITIKIFYRSASSIIRQGEVSKLQEVLEILQLNPEAKVELIGQSDYRGESDFNDELSRTRATSVLEWLVSRGIASDRVSSTAIGEVKGEGSTIQELQEYRATIIQIKGIK